MIMSSRQRPRPDSRTLTHEIALRLHPRQQAKWHTIHRSDLESRTPVWQHKNNLVEGFTKRHNVHTLVWYESHDTMESAIMRERALKAWKRSWKLALIEETNEAWRDLYEDIL